MSNSDPQDNARDSVAPLCDEFEFEWRNGSDPGIEKFLLRVPERQRQLLFKELIQIDVWWRKQFNKATSARQYLERFPEYTETIARAFPDGDTAPKDFETEAGLDEAGDPFATDALFSEPPQRGRYVFRRLLGEGGLGKLSIYYDTELRREVALKEIRPEYADSQRARRKFIDEALVTGLLEHPGVVPVYGFGTEDNGRPFYAMKLVDSHELFKDRIVQFHDAVKNEGERFEGPILRSLIRRLIDVCNVISHAHGRGVLHRDLKSINVMIGTHGETFVIDWGLQKTAGENLASSDEPVTSDSLIDIGRSSDQSEQGVAMGTIACAPPEQLNGRTDCIDARSDTYGIGSLLYEILTRQSPCAGLNRIEALKRIESQSLAAPMTLNNRVPKPLNEIAVKALSRDRESRYQSAKEMRDDLQRWLDDESVLAYENEPFSERLDRWRRRHESAVRWATGSLFLLTITSIASVFFINAAKNRQMAAKNQAIRLYRIARDATDDLLSKTSERLKQIPDSTDIRQQLLAEAAESYARMRDAAADLTDEPEFRRESAAAGIQLADVHRMLQNRQQAVESLADARKAIGNSLEVEDQIMLARTFIEESRVWGYGYPTESKSAIDQALTVTENVIDSQQGLSQGRLVRAEALIQRGVVADDAGDVTVASESVRAAIRLLDELLLRSIDKPTEQRARKQLVRAHTNAAYLEDGDRESTRNHFSLALSQAKWLEKEYENDPDVHNEYGRLLNNIGDHYLFDLGELDSADEYYSKSKSYFERVSDEKPLVLEYKSNLILAYLGLGHVSGERAAALDSDSVDPNRKQEIKALADETLRLYQSATDIADNLLGSNSNRIEFLRNAGQAKGSLGEKLASSDPQIAEKLLIEAVVLLNKSASGNEAGDERIEDEIDYYENRILDLKSRGFDADNREMLLDRLTKFVKETNFNSPRQQFNSACWISRIGGQIVQQDADTSKRVTPLLDTAIDRLQSSINSDATLYEIFLKDDDLLFIRQQRPTLAKKLQPNEG